jgi:UMF1 family MFS transporter
MFVIGFIVFKLQAGPVHRVKRAFINEDEDEYEDEDENENDYEIGDMDFAEERF